MSEEGGSGSVGEGQIPRRNEHKSKEKATRPIIDEEEDKHETKQEFQLIELNGEEDQPPR